MNKRDFIGKVVISSKSKCRFLLTKIHAAYIGIRDADADKDGTRSSYTLDTCNEDPFTSGIMYFEDASLTERFKKEYKEYCRTEEGRTEAWMYWMQTCN